MKKLIIAGGMALAAFLPGTAAAQSGSGVETVFRCTLRNGKTVSITAQGGNLFYAYGTPRRAELSLRGSARSGNVFFWQQRYASILSQVRFTRGDHHYILYSMGANGQTGSSAVSGLLVLRGSRRVSDHSCRRHAEFTGGFDLLNRLPQDSETYSAMSAGD